MDWDFGAKQFLEYTDSNNDTKFLYVPVAGNRLIEISENIQGDFGSAITTNYVSGRMSLSKYWKDFIKLNRVYIKLGNPRGTINFEVSGSQKNKPLSTLASKSIVPTSSNTGMGFDLMGNVQMGDSSGTPSTFSDTSDPRYLKIRKKLRDIRLRVYSNTYDTDYVLQSFIIEGNQIKINPSSSWKLS